MNSTLIDYFPQLFGFNVIQDGRFRSHTIQVPSSTASEGFTGRIICATAFSRHYSPNQTIHTYRLGHPVRTPCTQLPCHRHRRRDLRQPARQPRPPRPSTTAPQCDAHDCTRIIRLLRSDRREDALLVLSGAPRVRGSGPGALETG